MFDFLSIEISNNSIPLFINNPALKFQVIQQSFAQQKKIAKFKSWEITIIENKKTGYSKLFLRGSIHKYSHDGANYTDFTFGCLKIGLNQLKSDFNISLKENIIHNIEFGVNVNLPFSCNNILENIVSYMGISPSKKRFQKNGLMVEFRLSQYRVKLYNKSVQNNHLKISNTELLRFEIHVDRMQYLKSKGIKINCLQDLLKIEYYPKFLYLLEIVFMKIIMFNSNFNLDNLNAKEKAFLIEAINSRYWELIKKQKKEKLINRKFKLFKKVHLKAVNEQLQDIICQRIVEKWTFLTTNVKTNLK